MIKFSPANTKLKKLQKQIQQWAYSFDLPAGYTCPGARECLSQAVRATDGTMTVKDGPDTRYRCYAASQEALYKATHALRMNNFNELRKAQTVSKMYALLQTAIPHNADVIRMHTAGDFFNLTYYKAVCKLAENNPHILFYCYTKTVYFLDHPQPENMRITYSHGGRFDHLLPEIKQAGYSVAYVVQSAAGTTLPVDTTDFSAYQSAGDFALVIHGTQPWRKK